MSNFIRTLPGGSIFGCAEDTKSRVQKQMTMRCCRDEIVEMKLEYGKIKMESPIRDTAFRRDCRRCPVGMPRVLRRGPTVRMFGSAAGRRPVFVSGAWREMEKILSLFRFMRKTRSERQSGVKEF